MFGKVGSADEALNPSYADCTGAPAKKTACSMANLKIIQAGTHNATIQVI